MAIAGEDVEVEDVDGEVEACGDTDCEVVDSETTPVVVVLKSAVDLTFIVLSSTVGVGVEADSVDEVGCVTFQYVSSLYRIQDPCFWKNFKSISLRAGLFLPTWSMNSVWV